jgi:adenosylhomocysteine nucleosidase
LSPQTATLQAQDIPELKKSYGAIAGDWESGAIAWVAARNKKRVLILRGVSDVITESGSEAYGNIGYYQENARKIIPELIHHLPEWLDRVE